MVLGAAVRACVRLLILEHLPIKSSSVHVIAVNRQVLDPLAFFIFAGHVGHPTLERIGNYEMFDLNFIYCCL